MSLCLLELSVSREGSQLQLPSSRPGLGTVTREGGRGHREVRGHGRRPPPPTADSGPRGSGPVVGLLPLQLRHGRARVGMDG